MQTKNHGLGHFGNLKHSRVSSAKTTCRQTKKILERPNKDVPKFILGLKSRKEQKTVLNSAIGGDYW